MFPVNKMKFNKDKCQVQRFGISNEQSSNETGTDWFNTVPHTSSPAYERPSAYTLRLMVSHKRRTKGLNTPKPPKPLPLVEIHRTFVYLTKKKPIPTHHISSSLTGGEVSVGVLCLGLHLLLQRRRESVGENPQECKIIRSLESALKLSLKGLKLFSLKQKKTEKGHDKSIQICKRLLKEEGNKLFSLFTGVAQEEKNTQNAAREL